jgi:hypothetical protein
MEDDNTPTKAAITENLKLELSPIHSPLRVGQWYSLQVFECLLACFLSSFRTRLFVKRISYHHIIMV